MKLIKRAIIFLSILSLSLFGFTKVIRYPDPISAIRLGLAPASQTPTLMPWHEIEPATNPIDIPRGEEELPTEVQFQKMPITWQEFLDATYTNAFLIIRNG
ncbi:MAG: penicillin-binding protein, partial [bacterium]